MRPSEMKLLSNVIEGIRRELISISQKLQDGTTAIRDQQEAQSETGKSIEEVLNRIPIPEEVRKDERTQDYAVQERRHAENYTLQLVLTIGTWLAFIAAAVYAGIATFQWKEMRKATNAARDSADIAANALRENQRQFGITTKINQEQFKATLGQAEKGNETATGQLQLAQQQFKASQRPWIDVDGSVDIYQPQPPDVDGTPRGTYPRNLNGDPRQIVIPDSPITFSGSFKNVGHSPAVHTRPHVYSDFVQFPPQGTRVSGMADIPVPDYGECPSKPGGKVVVRSKSNWTVFVDKPEHWGNSTIASGPDIEDWIQLRKILFVHGCIQYDDELGDSHQTNFCSYLFLGDHPYGWRTCGMKNEAW